MDRANFDLGVIESVKFDQASWFDPSFDDVDTTQSRPDIKKIQTWDYLIWQL